MEEKFITLEQKRIICLFFACKYAATLDDAIEKAGKLYLYISGGNLNSD